MPSITCPVCGSRYAPEDGLHEGSIRDVLDQLLGFGRSSALILEYCHLFRLPLRGLSMERLARLVSELRPLWDSGQYQWDGVTYRTDKVSVIESLQETVNSKSIKPPLKNHNYLKQILHQKSQRVETSTERETEERRQSGRHRDLESGPQVQHDLEPIGDWIDPDQIAPPEVQELLRQGRIFDASQLWNKIKKEGK